MATDKHVLLSNPDKLVLLAEIPAADSCGSSQPDVTFRLLVEQCCDYGGGPVDVDTMLDNPTLRPEVAAEARRAAERVGARCGAVGGLAGVEFRLRVVFFGEFDLSSARSLHGQRAVAAYEDDDEDEDGCGAQFTVRPYRAGEGASLLLSGFEARSDGPELTQQHELTMEDDEAYQRALAGGTAVSPASRAAMVDQAL
ncbi:hypothetical protein VPH35_013549 [Triticum aestivum]